MKKQTTNKHSYSLRELIPEITGVNKLENTFEAEYKAVQRIVKVMKEITGREENRIMSDDKEAFVIITRYLYEMIKNDPTGKGHNLFSRMAAGEKLLSNEYDLLIEFFKEGLKANPKHPLVTELLERVDSEDRFYRLQDEIEQQVIRDINMLYEMESAPNREQRAKEYLTILQQFSLFESWRAEVQQDLKKERITKNILSIVTDKGMDIQKVLAGENLDSIKEITSEMIKKDVEAYLNSKRETDA